MKWAMHSLKNFAPILKENAPLAPHTSFRTGGSARYLFEPENEPQLASLVAFLKESRAPYHILGAGTNILVPDEGIDGAVIRLAGEFAAAGFQGTSVTAGAAVPLGGLVAGCRERGLSGAECLVGIPGTLGGALVMNAGGSAGQVASLVASVRVMTATGTEELGRSQIDFGYRTSSLAGKIILSATLELEESDPARVRERTEQILAHKQATQELSASTAGCIFKNPPGGPPAGALIEEAGLKGLRIGAAQVSTLHANFIINTGTATSGDILALVERVRSRVLEKFGIDLTLEIELW